MVWLDTRAFYSGSLDWWVHFFKGLVHNGIYNNTEFLEVGCFKFVFFPVIQKKGAEGYQRRLEQPSY